MSVRIKGDPPCLHMGGVIVVWVENMDGIVGAKMPVLCFLSV